MLRHSNIQAFMGGCQAYNGLGNFLREINPKLGVVYQTIMILLYIWNRRSQH